MEDIPVIGVINEGAFKQPAEANVIEKLRETRLGLLLRVAILEEQVGWTYVLHPLPLTATALRGN